MYDSFYVPFVATAQTRLGKLWSRGLAAPRGKTSHWCRHVFREFNKRADALASEALESRQSHAFYSPPPFPLQETKR
eukprot:1551228-Pyramimonas_sp.AAC.1